MTLDTERGMRLGSVFLELSAEDAIFLEYDLWQSEQLIRKATDNAEAEGDLEASVKLGVRALRVARIRRIIESQMFPKDPPRAPEGGIAQYQSESR